MLLPANASIQKSKVAKVKDEELWDQDYESEKDEEQD
jgi:hypothetical protein